MKFHFPILRMAPNGILLLAFPQSFGEWRAIIGRIRPPADQPNGAAGVNFADAARSGIRRHPTANNEVSVVWHEPVKTPDSRSGSHHLAAAPALIGPHFPF